MEVADPAASSPSTPGTLQVAAVASPRLQIKGCQCGTDLDNERSWRPTSGFASKHQVELETKCLYRERQMQRAWKIQQIQDAKTKRDARLGKDKKHRKHAVLDEGEGRAMISHGGRTCTDQGTVRRTSSVLLTLPSIPSGCGCNQSSDSPSVSVAVSSGCFMGQDEMEVADMVMRKRRHQVKRQQNTMYQREKGTMELVDGVPHPSLLGEVMFARRSSLQRLVDKLHVDDAFEVHHGRQSKSHLQRHLPTRSFHSSDYNMRKSRCTVATIIHQDSGKACNPSESADSSPRGHHAGNRDKRRFFPRSGSPQSSCSESDSHGSPRIRKCGDKRDFFFRNLAYEFRNQMLVDEVAEFSVTDSDMATKISQAVLDLFAPSKDDTTSESGNEDQPEDGTVPMMKHKKYPLVVTDGTACVGGNVLSFCDFFLHVNAIENDTTRVQMLQHNLQVLTKTNVTCIHANYLDVMIELQQDVVFLDPPWGGPEYKDLDKVDLFLGDVPLHEICTRLQSRTKCIVLKVPTNFDDVKFSRHVPGTVTIRRDLKKMHIVLLDFRVDNIPEAVNEIVV